jgi:hypothetical protein
VAWLLAANLWRQRLYRSLDGPFRWVVSLLVRCGLASVVISYGFPLSAPIMAVVQTLQTSVVLSLLGVFLLRLSLAPHSGTFCRQHKAQSCLMLVLVLDLVIFHTAIGRHGLGTLFQVVDVKRCV